MDVTHRAYAVARCDEDVGGGFLVVETDSTLHLVCIVVHRHCDVAEPACYLRGWQIGHTCHLLLVGGLLVGVGDCRLVQLGGLDEVGLGNVVAHSLLSSNLCETALFLFASHAFRTQEYEFASAILVASFSFITNKEARNPKWNPAKAYHITLSQFNLIVTHVLGNQPNVPLYYIFTEALGPGCARLSNIVRTVMVDDAD